MEKKYTVVSFYNYNCEEPIDFVHIYNSTEEDLRTKTSGSYASNWDIFKSVFDD